MSKIEDEEEFDVVDVEEKHSETLGSGDGRDAAKTDANDNVDEDVDVDDEDDDEDDEDDEEGVTTKKRRRNMFIDDIAEVSEDDDEEEDDEEAENLREEFIAGDQDEDTGPADSRVHRKIDRARESEKNEDMEAIAKKLKHRYGKSSQRYRGDRVVVSQKLLMPSVNDPSIWAVKCGPGKEIALIKKLMNRKLSLAMTKNPIKIFSAFQRDNITGFIYVEAARLQHVTEALRGLPNVFVSRGFLNVPVEEYPDLLRPKKSTDVEMVPGIFVRIKRGLYKGDIAIVEDISENGLEVLCKVVPRLDYGRYDDLDAGKRKRATTKHRPQSKLFSVQEAEKFDMRNPVIKESSNTYRYKGETYKNGFLYKDFKLQFLQANDVRPSLTELTRFNLGSDDGFDASTISESLKQLKQSRSASSIFRPGDTVEVINGEQRGLRGVITSAERKDIVTIRLSVKDQTFKNSAIEIPVTNIRKTFDVGDKVTVMQGKHAGNTGIVIEVKGSEATLVSDQSEEDFTVFTDYLNKSGLDDSYNVKGVDELHELVRLDQQNFGVIIRTVGTTAEILCQDGRVVTNSTGSYFPIKLNKEQSVSTDANGKEIGVGDTVKEKSGERRQGTILYIYKNVLFLTSKTLKENNGTFVCPSLNVTVISTKSTLSTSTFKAPDYTKMNPKLQIQKTKSMGFNARTLGRDKTINQRVAINSGPYKSLKGIVKDANGDTVRVELHTRNKTISVSKDKLSFYKPNGELEPFEKWSMSNSMGRPYTGGRNTNGRQSDSYGGGTAYASNGSGNRSSWSGGAKGSWFGGATAYGSGNRTAYGGGTAYGSKTPAYGSRTPGAAWSSRAAETGAGSAWGGNKSSYGGGSAWGGNKSSYGSAWGGSGNKTSYGGGTAYGGGGTSYGGASAWNPNAGSHGAEAATPWNAAPTPGISAPTPGAPTPGGDWTAETPAVAPTPGGEYNYDDGYDGYEN